MARSGVVAREDIISQYVKLIHTEGGRKSKKTDKLIDQLCEESPLASLKGNTKNSVIKNNEQMERSETVKKKKLTEEFQQLSFEDFLR